MSTPSIISAIKKLCALLSRSEKLKWIGIVGFAVCTSVLEMLTAFVIATFAQVLNEPGVGQVYLLKVGFSNNLSASRIIFYIALMCGGIYLIKNLIAFLEVLYQNLSIQKMNYDFKNKLLHRYAKTDYGFYLTRNSSLGIQVIGSDAEQVFSNSMISLSSILSEGVVFLGLVAIVILLNPMLAGIIFGLGSILTIIISKGLLPRFYNWGQKLQETALYCSQNLFQFFHAFKEIILLNKREEFINSYQVHSKKKSRVQAVQTSVNALPRMVIEVLFVGLFVISVTYLCLKEEQPIQMMGVLGSYVYVSFRLMPGLNRIINHLNTFKGTIPSIQRVYDEYYTVAAREHYIDAPLFDFRKTITICNMSFRYPNTEKKALSHINWTIRKGECVGIIGETGSGKSTLVDTILGLLTPCEGTILIDDKYPVNSYQWHERIGYVPQSIYLIDDTIAANIAFGKKIEDIDKNRLNQVIDEAQLRIFVDSLPLGFNTVVGERGIRLSGGERQRIAIARALYRNPEVLLFDEATSALDNETEMKLMETIRQVSYNRTVIMIAHRLTTLKDCSYIIQMENGGIKRIIDGASVEAIKLQTHV